MAIAKWSGQGEPDADALKRIAVELTEQAVAGIGGLKRFVSRGDVVWVKPNIGWDRTPELAANTNPDVVATLVRLCYAAGAKKVKVGDNPCDLAKKSYHSSGIAAAAEAAGAGWSSWTAADSARRPSGASGSRPFRFTPRSSSAISCSMCPSSSITAWPGPPCV